MTNLVLILLFTAYSTLAFAQDGFYGAGLFKKSNDFITSKTPQFFGDANPKTWESSWERVEFITNLNLAEFGSKDSDDTYVEILRQSYVRLSSNKRVYVLNSEMEEKLGITKFLSEKCAKQKKKHKKNCMNDLAAFYMPIVDVLFIKDGSWKKFGNAFLHDLIHATQFTFSLPWDLYVLFQHVDSKDIEKKEEVLEYLAYHYERQGNYHEVRSDLSSPWYDEHVMQIPLLHEMKMAAIAPVNFIGRTVGADPNGWIEEIPLIDQPIVDQYFQNSYRSAFLPHELIETHRSHMIVGNQFDLELHNKFSNRLAKTYGFQRKKNNKIFAKMYDKFYENILLYKYPESKIKWTESQNCLALFSKVQSYPSPLLGWLNVSAYEVVSCEAFAGMDPIYFSSIQKKFLDLLSKNMNAPLDITFQGGEGGSGDFDFLPSIPFMPQLRVRP